VRQWNQLLELSDELNSDVGRTFDGLSQRVKDFEKFGIDNALS
jgi:hypothetical protein